MQLDRESSMLTTFQTCYGRYRFVRLLFRTSVSSEIFQKKLLEAFGGLPGIVCIADDGIIHGEDLEERDRNLIAFMELCRDNGIKLNREKRQLRMSEVTFMGHCITKDGLQSDPENVKAIAKMAAPTNVEEQRRYLGMVNYIAKCMPHMTDVIYPLRNLTKHDVTWTWSDSPQDAFETVRQMIINAPVLEFYDPTKELRLENDASEYGLGSALFQEGKPVAYASRTLTETEKRYAQIEKEMLAVSFGLEKFHHYTYGRHVSVDTDHKPLVVIVTKPLSKAPKRLQALLRRTQKYNYLLTYKSGKSITVADDLSRSPLPDTPCSEQVSVNNLSFLPIKSDRLDEIRVATERDESLSCLKSTIMKGWPPNKDAVPISLTPYFSYRDELTVQDGVILRGERVVIPAAMRPDIKVKLHAGHMGIKSCLRRARELVFWPGMSSEIRQYIESCDTCATHSDKQAAEPLFMHEVPGRPWQNVGTYLLSFEGKTI